LAALCSALPYTGLCKQSVPRFGETISIRLRAPIDAPIEQIVLRTFPNGEQQLTEMQPEGEEAGWLWWNAKLTVLEHRVPFTALLSKLRKQSGGLMPRE